MENIFSRKAWKNMIAQFPNRRKLVDPENPNNYKSYNVSLDVGNIEEEGHEFEASEMNDLESRISDAFNIVENAFNSIDEEMQEYVSEAAGSATNSQNSSYNSEAWAVGEKNGIPVTSISEQYENNSKYYAEQSSTNASNALTYKNAAAISAGDSSRYATDAQSSASNSSTSATLSQGFAETSGNKSLISEGYAVGTQNGEPVASDSEYYHNNALYYSQLSNPELLENLQNVNITSVTNGQVLKYNSTTEKWENEDAGGSADDKMDKANPTGTGAFSLNRKANTTIGDYSFAEGYNTTASADSSHSEGRNTRASGSYSHAEGFGTTASGSYSHAEGFGTTASGSYSHASGKNTLASGDYQMVIGRFNVEDTTKAFIIGGGLVDSSRLNALTVDWDGVTQNSKGAKLGEVKEATLAAGSTSVTFTNVPSDALVDVYTPAGIVYKSITTSGTSLTLTFDAQANNITVKIEIH